MKNKKVLAVFLAALIAVGAVTAISFAVGSPEPIIDDEDITTVETVTTTSLPADTEDTGALKVLMDKVGNVVVTGNTAAQFEKAEAGVAKTFFTNDGSVPSNVGLSAGAISAFMNSTTAATDTTAATAITAISFDLKNGDVTETVVISQAALAEIADLLAEAGANATFSVAFDADGNLVVMIGGVSVVLKNAITVVPPEPAQPADDGSNTPGAPA